MFDEVCLVKEDDGPEKKSPQWVKWKMFPGIDRWWTDKTMRQVLALDKQGQILFISVHASIPDLCEILEKKQVKSALNLDGGRSTATMVNKPHNQNDVDGGRSKLAIVNTPQQQIDETELICKVQWEDIKDPKKCGRPILTAIVAVPN